MLPYINYLLGNKKHHFVDRFAVFSSLAYDTDRMVVSQIDAVIP